MVKNARCYKESDWSAARTEILFTCRFDCFCSQLRYCKSAIIFNKCILILSIWKYLSFVSGSEMIFLITSIIEREVSN